MSFHPKKCSTLHMTRRREKIKSGDHLYSHRPQEETQMKYLGVTITDDLKWGPHILNITNNKANRTLGYIRRNIKIANKKIKETAYKPLVRPVLEHANPVWDPCT